MSTSRGAWALSGVVAGSAGVAASYCVAETLSLRTSPVVAVADLVVRLTPGPVAERAIQALGHRDKPLLLAGILVLSAALFAAAGLLARRSGWAAGALLVALAAVGGIAVAAERGATAVDQLPVAVGLGTWLVCLRLLGGPLRAIAAEEAPAPSDPSAPPALSRRTFLLRVGTTAAAAGALGLAGRVIGRGRRRVEQARQLLRLPRVTAPPVPADVTVDLPGVSPWLTPARDFYRVDTAIVAPTVTPDEWRLRIHGLVDREVVLTYQQLLGRRWTQAWVTLNCVSNVVGGSLIGNAWWSGIRVADLLREAGVQEGADAVLQTSEDGWTCGTPLAALTDGRDALLAVAMNGEPLPIEHGFPVRTIVPGLYGYVSACKWVVDMEITRFADISAFWTQRGWSERGPVKLSSRIDVPAEGGEVRARGGRVGGVAWAQHIGIRAVEISVDDGAWQPASLAGVPSDDTWVQWVATLDVAPGEHTLRVRAVDRAGLVQTGVERPPVPDGATGWHTVRFRAVEG